MVPTLERPVGQPITRVDRGQIEIAAVLIAPRAVAASGVDLHPVVQTGDGAFDLVENGEGTLHIVEFVGPADDRRFAGIVEHCGGVVESGVEQLAVDAVRNALVGHERSEAVPTNIAREERSVHEEMAEFRIWLAHVTNHGPASRVLWGMRISRAALPVVAAVVLAACGTVDDGSTAGDDAAASADSDDAAGDSDDAAGDSDDAAGDEDDASATEDPPASGEYAPDVVATELIESTAREDVPSGLETYRDPISELPEPAIDLSRLRSGGPPPDGIPSIDDPVFQTAASATHLSPQAPVLALEIDGDARAYPLEVMVWHEIVNDTVGGVPVAVAYCPLCNSVTVHDRRVEGRVLDFGVSGLLYNSSLVMFDRQTETLWSHFAGRPLYGELGEADLVDYPATIVGFDEWRTANPDGLVLTRETGVSRDYGVNPYPGYDDVNSDPFLFEGEVDGRYTPMTRVVGVEVSSAEIDGGALAFPLLELQDAGVMTGALGGDEVVAFWVPGSASAIDAFDVADGVDVGATGVFLPEVDGQTLTFSVDPGDPSAFVDEQTGSTWNVFGESTDGELVGTQLDQLVHIDTFWFAWNAFHPDSAIAS